MCYKIFVTSYNLQVTREWVISYQLSRNEKASIKEGDFITATEPATANRICLVVDLTFLVSLLLTVFILQLFFGHVLFQSISNFLQLYHFHILNTILLW